MSIIGPRAGVIHDKNDEHDHEMSLVVVIYFWTVDVDHDQMLEKISVRIGNGHSWSIIMPYLGLDTCLWSEYQTS